MVGPTELINKDEVKAMSQTIQERNKALVLEAFDTLFNKRDYVAAERYWSPKYVQHSAHIAPGPRPASSIPTWRMIRPPWRRRASSGRIRWTR